MSSYCYAFIPDSLSSDNLPTFHHISCVDAGVPSPASPAEAICIRIQFIPGPSKHAMLLKRNKNIFKGYILETLNSIVLTGNWDGDFTDTTAYFITVSNDLVPNQKRFQRNGNGSTSLVNFHKSIDFIDDNNKNDQHASTSNSGQSSINLIPKYSDHNKIPSAGWELDIIAFYDDSLFEVYRENEDDAKAYIERIMSQMEPMFDSQFSFPTKIKLNVHDISHARGKRWEASDTVMEDISKTSNLFTNDSRIYFFFCSPTNKDLTKGQVQVDGIGKLCHEDRIKRAAIVESSQLDQNDEMNTALTAAHEIGHLLGINHDFYYLGKKKEPRFVTLDNGKTENCANIGGIMDQVDFATEIDNHEWTECSKLDLRTFYIDNRDDFCLKKLPTKEYFEYTEEGNQVRLKCDHRCDKSSISGFTWEKQTPTEYYEILTKTTMEGYKFVEYNMKKLDQIDQENVQIDASTSSGDVIIRKAQPSDAGDYICNVKSIFHQNCEETLIVKLGVETGEISKPTCF